MKTRRAFVRIPPVGLEGELTLPAGCSALVIFAHGSGSSRHSPRNMFVAGQLNEAGLATLLIDLLTPEEERGVDLRFDIPLLAERVVQAVDWAGTYSATKNLVIGLFGASTGAAAALVAAAQRRAVFAVVSRGGRPDLAGAALARVHAPTLLIVGGYDDTVLELNREARQELAGPSDLAIVPGATHLFEEPRTLEQVATRAAEWFVTHSEVPDSARSAASSPGPIRG
jgi:pimeloyl-ACP methyl ester carboxylesterase